MESKFLLSIEHEIPDKDKDPVIHLLTTGSNFVHKNTGSGDRVSYTVSDLIKLPPRSGFILARTVS